MSNLKIQSIDEEEAFIDNSTQVKSDEDQMSSEPIEETPEEISLLEKYFPRFIKFIEFNFDIALILIKNWIEKAEENQACTLQVLGQSFEEELLNRFFERLTFNERAKWKDLIKGQITIADFKKASTFVNEELTREMLSNSTNYDIELFDLISRFNTHIISQFCEKYPDYSGAFLNVLPPNVIAKLLNELPQDQAAKYIEESFKVVIHKGDQKYKDLKAKLNEFIIVAENKPFTSKLLEMLPTFNPLREMVLYKSLFSSLQKDEIIQTAQYFFPYTLFTSLPQEIVREGLKAYPEENRVNFLASLSSNDKDYYLNALAQPGTPLRDMVDLSLSEIEGNPARLKVYDSAGPEYIKHFIKFFRNFLVEKPAYSSQLRDILEIWIEKQKSGADNVLSFQSKG